MTDDCLEFRAKVVMAEADDLIWRLSNVEDFFRQAIFSLKCYQWNSDELRPYLEKAEAKVDEADE